MSEEKKINVRKCEDAFRAGDLDGLTLEEALDVVRNAFGGKPENALLDYDYDGHYSIIYYRDETDEEFAQRVYAEKSKTSIQEDEERRNLRELLKKYPDVVAEHQKQG